MTEPSIDTPGVTGSIPVAPTNTGQQVAYSYVECPNDDECPMCANEACNKCGAGCWSSVRDCKHDVVERHEYPTP